MKKLLLSAAVLSVVGLNAQNEPTEKTKDAVGINEEHPKATLDVNGDFRVQEVTKCTNCEWVLVQGADGVVKKVALSKFTLKDGETPGGGGSSSETQPGQGGSHTDPNKVGGTASFTALSNVEEDILSFKYGNRTNDKIQGQITSTKIPVKIPYRGATAGNVEEKIIEVEGHPNLKLKIKAATISAGNGALDAEIYYDGNGNYNLPLVTLQQVEAGNIKKATDVTFKVKVKGVTNPVTVKVNSLGGIPDKKFNEGSDHKFVYVPVTVKIGNYSKVWLNQNLGADYAKVGSGFSARLGGTSKKDYKAYGSLFQWGRVDNSGYELVKWTSSSSGTKVKPNAGWKSDPQLRYYTDPCPNGYHTPSAEEWKDLHQAITGSRSIVSNSNLWSDTKLNLPAAGAAVSYDGKTINGVGLWGFYYSSTPYLDHHTYAFYYKEHVSDPDDKTEPKHFGLSVRCIKD